MPRVWGHLLQGSRPIAPQVWSIAPILSRAFGLLLIRSPPPAVGHYHDLHRRRHHDRPGLPPCVGGRIECPVFAVGSLVRAIQQKGVALRLGVLQTSTLAPASTTA